MGSAKKKIIYFSIYFLIAVLPLYPKSICILFDMSGSMRYYGDWTHDVSSSLQKILEEGRINEKYWTLTGGKIEILRNLKLSSNDNISFLKFGSIQYSEFPYFADPKSSEVDPSFSLIDFLQNNLPSLNELKDLKTNKSLAKSVAAQILDNMPKPWHLIVISDFLQDAKMTRNQTDFVDQVETCYFFDDLAAFSWEANDKVRMRVLKVQKKPECEEEREEELPSDISISLIKPGHKKEFKTGKAIAFQWRTDRAESNISYGLYVNHRKDNKKIFAKSNIRRTSYSVSSKMSKKWKSGEYVWKITAKLDNKIIGRSSSRIFKIKGESIAPLLILVLLILVLAGGYAIYKKIKKRKEEAE